MKFNIKKEQEICGNLISTDGSTIHQNVRGRCKFNRYYLSESYIYFDIETNLGNYRFEIEPNIKLLLSFSKGFHPTYFDISEAHILTDKKNINYEFESGCLNGLQYFHKEIRYNDIVIKKQRVPNKYTTKNSQYYYSIQSDSVTDFESADLIFLILSTMTGTKFFSRVLKDKSGEIVYRQRFAKCSRIYSIGSGRLIFPIEFSEIMQLGERVNIDFLKSVLLMYTSFCTSNNIRDRLLMGCSLLDYLLEIFQKTVLNKVNRENKSKLLYQLISEIVKGNAELEIYIKKMFKNFPEELSEIKSKGLKFDFFENRDKFLHRGELLLNGKQLIEISKTIFSLNEILRILILNLDKIGFTVLDNFPVIETNDIEEIIELRRKIISKEW